MHNPFSLEGKTVLVTGASSGIGRVTAIECAKLGARVIVTGRNEERLKGTFDELGGDGHLMIIADLNDDSGIHELVKKMPPVNGIVHAAGINDTILFQFIKRDTNFFAPVLLSQSLLKNKLLTKGGSIVFLSSIDGPITIHIGNSMYSATKGAISSIMRSMAVELAVRFIRVNAILPGMTETPLIHKSGITREQLNEDMKLYPLRRYAKPEEIAYAIIYFLSDASSFTTGSSLVIDGGFSLL